MNEAVLQVLLILAYLAIGLISVTFPIYAISVNFLPQQKWESEKERKKRMDDLRTKITELTGELKGDKKKVEQLREQLDKYETELMGTELRVKYLTAVGAVVVPVTILVLALLFAAVGVYAFYKDLRGEAISLGVLSALFSSVALYRLYKTISAVEYGALRPERTVEFDVGFGKDRLKTINIKFNEKTMLSVYAETSEHDIENFVLYLRIPADLGVKGQGVVRPNVVFTEFEDFTITVLYREFIPRGMAKGITFPTFPKKVGKHPITVRVCGKGIYEYRKELIVEVV